VKSDSLAKVFVLAFVVVFFLYLFGPLLLMSVSAFNSSAFPRVTPFECFTVEWFDVLINDDKLMDGLRNSLIIGTGVVLFAVPIGLAGALMLTQVSPRLRPWYYTITISPILIPGVVLGISTLVFWDRLGAMFGANYDSLFYNGIFLTIIGQATFISAYSMLVFISRLQRFDPAQEEAALDLGATNVQAFRKVLLPFLKPAIGSAAVLAFLASFENYNTTVFTIVADSTLTTVLASKVRYGINPSISALAVVIITLTLIGAVFYEILQRREALAEKASEAIARGETATRAQKAALYADPAVIVALLIFIAGFGTLYYAGTLGVEECKTVVKAEKLRKSAEATRRRETLEMFKGAAPGSQTGTGAATTAPKTKAKGTEGYGSIFDPTNLQQQSGDQSTPEPEKKEEPAPAESPGKSQFQNIFDPSNLQQQSGSDSSTQ
jgi:spermidine/putrescine transport system permease protein